MADGTSIEWADATWQPITGCSVVSPGCTNCYAMRLAGTRIKHHRSRAGLTQDTKAGPVWNGIVRWNEEWRDQPLRWRKPRRIFVCAHGDLFHESVPDEWIRDIFEIMFHAHQHTFLVLTKRARRMREFCEGKAFLQNVWLGVSVEDQQRADERIPDLLATPAAKRFISAEPLLGPVDLLTTLAMWQDSPERRSAVPLGRLLIDWVIVGGESGPGARPMRPDWARSLRDQCVEAGVAFHFKQWGEHAYFECRTEAERTASRDKLNALNPRREWDLSLLEGDAGIAFARVGKKAAGRLLDGREHSEFPA